MSAIEARGLRKVYRSRLGGRSVEALAGIDLRVEPGEIFGLLGPNGAGKTTTVKILLGLTHATAGKALLFGIPVGDPASRRRVGYLPEGHRFPGYLTARETLSIFGRMSGVAPRDLLRRIPGLLERVRPIQARRDRRGRCPSRRASRDRRVRRTRQRTPRPDRARYSAPERSRGPPARPRRATRGIDAPALFPRRRLRRPRLRVAESRCPRVRLAEAGGDRRGDAGTRGRGDQSMRAWAASVEEVFREASARWT